LIIHINVVKTTINNPFGNGKYPTYKNGDLGGLFMIVLPTLMKIIMVIISRLL